MFFSGAFRHPAPTHFHYRVFPISSVPRDEAGLLKWLYDRYVEKDNFLRSLYDTSSMSSVATSPTPRAALSRDSVASVPTSSKHLSHSALQQQVRRSVTTESFQHAPGNGSSNFVDVLSNGLRVPNNAMRSSNSSWHVLECAEVSGHRLPFERHLSMDGVHVAFIHFFFIASLLILGSLYRDLVFFVLGLFGLF